MSLKFKTQEINRKNHERWNKLLLNAVNGSYRQTIAWEHAREDKNRQVYAFIFQENGQDIAGVHYSIKKSLFNLVRTADILSGFVFAKEPNKEQLEFLVDHFINWAKQKKASYLRINFWLPHTIASKKTQYLYLIKDIINEYDFKPIAYGRHTYWVDLALTEEQLLSEMKRQTRYEVRKGMKSSIEFKQYNTFNIDQFSQFWDIYSNLGKRKDFNILSYSRFQKEIKYLMDSRLAVLIFAYYENNVINITLASNFGQGSYIYGAMNPEFKKLGNCPSPGHIAQWEMMMFMKSKGIKIYDMGFCPGSTPIKSDPSYNIWRFKYGFGGNHVQFLPTYGKVLTPIEGRIFQYIKYGMQKKVENKYEIID